MIDPTRPTARTNKAPRDTVAGCRSRAEADLLASVSMLNANERSRMELSASSWRARADLLQRESEHLLALRATQKRCPSKFGRT
jgi:hypothetical protein